MHKIQLLRTRKKQRLANGYTKLETGTLVVTSTGKYQDSNRTRGVDVARTRMGKDIGRWQGNHAKHTTQYVYFAYETCTIYYVLKGFV